MNRINKISRVIIKGVVFLFLAGLAGIFVISCGTKQKEEIRLPKTPYPDAGMAIYLQSQVDSSRFTWFTDVKAAASSFCNEELSGYTNTVTVGDMTVLDESMFHARVEVHLPQDTLLLTMERAFKEKGTHSIWQVVKMEKKKG
jgi:hypothetical protein